MTNSLPLLRKTVSIAIPAVVSGDNLRAVMPRHLDQNDVVSLLRKEIKLAGGQSAWSRKTGIHRSTVNRVLGGYCTRPRK